MRLFIFAGIMCSLAPTALAQEAPLDGLYACSAIAEGPARLACFDTAVASLKQAQSSGGIAVVSREFIAEAEKEAFGLEAPRLSQLARSAAPVTSNAATPAAPARSSVEVDKVMLTVKSFERRPNGSYRFTMENGQIWDQIDAYDLGALPRNLTTAEVSRATMGSYMIKPGNRAAVRARRVK